MSKTTKLEDIIAQAKKFKPKPIIPEQAEQDLKKRIEYERMLAEISSILVSGSNSGLLFDSCMARIGEVYDVSRIYIYQRRGVTNTFDISAEWNAEGIANTKELGQQTIELPVGTEVLLQGNPIGFPEAQKLPFPEEQTIMENGQIVSILAVPMFIQNQMFGFIGFDECRDVREWYDEDVYILSTAAQIISRSIEAKQRSEELSEQRNRLTAIFRSVSDGIVTANTNMSVIEANDAVKKICNITVNNIIGKPFSSKSNWCGRSCQLYLNKVLEEKASIRDRPVNCRRKDGVEQKVSITTSPLLGDSGEFTGAVMVVKDITRLSTLEKELGHQRQYRKMVSRNPRMLEIFDQLEDLADLETTVLITGESGTGKELIARALHQNGARHSAQLVKVNCAALNDSILESELFGHVKGAFTGAISDKVGRFQAANGGTILLDEIGDISPLIQVKLLRVLQEKEFERVGESVTSRVDVRIIASTNRDLRAKIKAGEFREDLFYRLKVMEIHLPPLRERKEDIPDLIKHFLQLFNKKYSKKIRSVDEKVMQILLNHNWPGNIRELEHVMERSVVLCHFLKVTSDVLPSELFQQSDGFKTAVRRPIHDLDSVTQALERTGWNQTKAAIILGINRRTLFRKIKKFGLEKPSHLK